MAGCPRIRVRVRVGVGVGVRVGVRVRVRVGVRVSDTVISMSGLMALWFHVNVKIQDSRFLGT